MKKISKLFLLAGLLATFSVSRAQHYTADWNSLDQRPVPGWFTDAKFGIFIHWGVYSVPAWAPVGPQYSVYSKYAEWYWNRLVTDSSNVGQAFRRFHLANYGPNFKYVDFAPQFKAELFSPQQWADVFAASGAKYIVLTAKHHEGFALWPSPQSWNWNSADIGPHRDLAGDLTRAVKAKGLKMGFYYSLYEWFNPQYKNDIKGYVDQHMLPQLKDLVNRYRPAVIWTDGEWDQPAETWRSQEFLSWLYNDSPVKNEIVVNDRWGKDTRGKHGGYYTTEYDLVGETNARDTRISHPWEECRAIGGSFGLNRNENLADYNSAADLVHVLIEKVAKGGNLLLDIGPAADGTIPVIMQQRLLEIGEWLKINGESIYHTTIWEAAPKIKDIYFTKSGHDLYVHYLNWPTAPLQLTLARKPSNIALLAGNSPVNGKMNGSMLLLQPPAWHPNIGSFAWVVKLSNAL